MYALLCNYASEKDHCWPSHATLAARLSCSVSSVKNYLGELVREKLIAMRREQYRSSVYYMLRPGASNCQEAKSDGVQPENACPKPNSGYLNNLNKQSQENNPALPPLVPETPDVSPAPKVEAPAAWCVSVSDFESAWELYPKKDAQGFARMAWLKLQRSGQLPPLNSILAAIRRFNASESWQREQGRFVPQMGNWLRGQRWLDPLPPAETAKTQSREEMHLMMQIQEEQEKRIQEHQNAEKARQRPVFDAFAAKFTEPRNERVSAMAFGTWLFLRSKNMAPLASDVPADNTLEIVDFMNAFKRKSEESAYRERSVQPSTFSGPATDGPKLCAELLRPGAVFNTFFSGIGELRRAV